MDDDPLPPETWAALEALTTACRPTAIVLDPLLELLDDRGRVAPDTSAP